MNELNCTVDLIIIGTNQIRSDYTDKLTKFMLRGVAKNLPWINQIFLVLPNLESLPAELNLSEFKILLYEDIIPQDILDKVSKHNIELFVPNICENTPTNNVIKTNFNKLENILLRVIFCIKYLLSRKNYG